MIIRQSKAQRFFRNRLVLDKFSGRMMSDGDNVDIQETDAINIKNMRAKTGTMVLDRDMFDMVDLSAGTIDLAVSGMKGVNSFFDEGSLVICAAYNSDAGDYNVDYMEQASEGAAPTVKSRVVLSGATVSTGYAKERFIYSRGMMRFGGDKDTHGGTMDLSRGASQELLSEAINGEGYSVTSCRLWDDSDSVIGATGLHTTLNYDEHTVGLLISEASGPVLVGSEDKYVTYGVSLIYDGYQESPLTVTSVPKEINYSKAVELTVLKGNDVGSQVGLDQRITAVNIYRSALDTDTPPTTNDFYLVYSIDALNSASPAIVDDLGNEESWAAGAGPPSANLRVITINDIFAPKSESYYARTTVDIFNRAETSNGGGDNIVEFDPYWDIGLIVKSHAVVRTLKYMEDGKYIEPVRTMSVSVAGKPDVFLPNSTITFESSGGGEFVAIRNLGADRIALFDEQNITVVNVSNDPQYWFVEKDIPLGVGGSEKVADTPYGLVIIGDEHLYLLDPYGEIKPLTLNNETEWQKYSHGNAHAHYDSLSHVFYVTGIQYAAAYSGAIYDFKTQNFLFSDPPFDADANCVGFGGKLYFLVSNATTDSLSIYKSGDDSNTLPAEYKTKIFQLGIPDVAKVLRSVAVTYKCTDGATLTLYDEDGASLGSDTLPASGTTNTHVYRLSTPFDKIQFKITASTDDDLEIHEIVANYFYRLNRWPT